MKIVISNSSGKPIYRQIADQIISQILSGNLPAGYALPPIRTVAKELHISVITVKKAWEELERENFINTMVGRGCFVADISAADLLDKRKDMIEKRIRIDVAHYKELGVRLDDIIEILEKHFSN